jgi:hypothetical protein
MKLQRKAFDLLNLRDFESSPIWLVELPDRAFATAVEPVDDIAVYGPYVALTVYSLADGTTVSGFCFAYDCSGHVLFSTEGEPIYLADYGGSCAPDDAAVFAKRLGKKIEEVFPIQFTVSVKYYGSVQEGKISIQPNRQSRVIGTR